MIKRYSTLHNAFKLLFLVFSVSILCLFGGIDFVGASETPKINDAKPIVDGVDEKTDFSAIKDLIKKDGLEKKLEKKMQEKKSLKLAEKKREEGKYKIPEKDQFWPFFFQVWLAKNAVTLKWDFQKPEFGIEDAYQQLLSELGFIKTPFKILLLDSVHYFRMSFRGPKNEVIHLLSLPLIRTLDLSKVEIAILLLEDYVRLQKNQLIQKLETKELNQLFGTSFIQKQFPKKEMDMLETRLKDFLLNVGFNFNDQFEVTKEMDVLLKPNQKIWDTYYMLLQKIDSAVKNNTQFKKYPELFPSPELQMNWLKPKEKVI